MDVLRDAFDLVRAWLTLPDNERQEFKRHIETRALQYRDAAPDLPSPAKRRKKPQRTRAA